MGDGYLCVEQNVDNRGRIIPSALVESGCRIADGARIGGRVVLEHGVTVGEHTTIERAVVMQGTEIGSHCTLNGCIIGGGVRIGDHCTIDGMSVLGEGVTLGAGNVVSNGARCSPASTCPTARCSSDGRARPRGGRGGRLDRPGRGDPRPAEHLRDALWRVDSAGIAPSTRPAG